MADSASTASRSQCRETCLNTVAVGDLTVLAARIVRVEEILVVVLVLLPAREKDAKDQGDDQQNNEQRRLVGAQRLRARRSGGVSQSSHTARRTPPPPWDSHAGGQPCPPRCCSAASLCFCAAPLLRAEGPRRTMPVPSPPTPLARLPKSRAPFTPPMAITGCHLDGATLTAQLGPQCRGSQAWGCDMRRMWRRQHRCKAGRKASDATDGLCGQQRLTCGRATLLRESMLGAPTGAKASTHARAANRTANCQGVGQAGRSAPAGQGASRAQARAGPGSPVQGCLTTTFMAWRSI